MSSVVRKHSGFTLIEMVVVLAVLAAVASLVIPKVDFVRRSADTATTANGQGNVASNLQFHRVAKGTFPNRFDSLIEGDAASTTIYGKLPMKFSLGPGQFSVGPIHATPSPTTLSYVFPSPFTLMNHDPAVTYASDSGATEVPVAVATTNFVKIVEGSTIAKGIYPPNGTFPTTTRPVLIALGVGPQCTAVGNSMISAPLYTTTDPAASYGRYIAIFAVYPETPGKRAELKGVVDPAGQSVNTNLKNYYQNQNE